MCARVRAGWYPDGQGPLALDLRDAPKGSYPASVVERPETWHHGLMARWWAEFNVAEPRELAYYRAAIERFGQPALDLGCGAGRLLVPLMAAGLDLDGSDLSADMIARAAELAAEQGLQPLLRAQAIHELDLPRRYRTIFMCGVIGLGGTREQDRLGLRRVFEHLTPGGALIFSHDLPYSDADRIRWERWLPGHRADVPRAWAAEGERRATHDGDEIELMAARHCHATCRKRAQPGRPTQGHQPTQPLRDRLDSSRCPAQLEPP